MTWLWCWKLTGQTKARQRRTVLPEGKAVPPSLLDLHQLTTPQEAHAVGAQQSKAIQEELQLLGAAFQLEVIPDLHMSAEPV